MTRTLLQILDDLRDVQDYVQYVKHKSSGKEADLAQRIFMKLHDARSSLDDFARFLGVHEECHDHEDN